MSLCLSVIQEAEEARKKLYELQAIAAAVESSGHTKAEAHVSILENEK
jgi:hypothetical protein